jgi:hypothetical protein
MSERTDNLATELEARRNEHGKIVPTEVVAWARKNPKSRLHAQLEWNDSIAAERYRIDQVRELLQVHIVDPQGHRRYISLSIDRNNGGGYRSMSDVESRQDLRAIMLQDALGELERVERLYHVLKELRPVWKVVAGLRPRAAA